MRNRPNAVELLDIAEQTLSGEVAPDMSNRQRYNVALIASAMGIARRELAGGVSAWDEELEPLKSFILPGGSEAAARLHVARTVCRRAERALASLAACGEGEVDERIPVFLNRLSDWLFVFARQVNAGAGVEDIPWQPPRD